MPLISIAELLSASIVALQGQGFSRELAAEIAEEFVVSELTGTKTHGVGKLGRFSSAIWRPNQI
jgi:LDH2 family malate/lactate/ureidoglycolate dehydrogenase